MNPNHRVGIFCQFPHQPLGSESWDRFLAIMNSLSDLSLECNPGHDPDDKAIWPTLCVSGCTVMIKCIYKWAPGGRGLYGNWCWAYQRRPQILPRVHHRLAWMEKPPRRGSVLDVQAVSSPLKLSWLQAQTHPNFWLNVAGTYSCPACDGSAHGRKRPFKVLFCLMAWESSLAAASIHDIWQVSWWLIALTYLLKWLSPVRSETWLKI